MNIRYSTRGTCAKEIQFNLEDGKISNIQFTGGCLGNLAAISKLLEGADAQQTADTLRGNLCGKRPTSCADQLAQAIDQALAS